MDETYAEDVTFTDAGGVVSGREAPARNAHEILDGSPPEFARSVPTALDP